MLLQQSLPVASTLLLVWTGLYAQLAVSSLAVAEITSTDAMVYARP